MVATPKLLDSGYPTHSGGWLREDSMRSDQAEILDDLRVPPGNRLEALRGDRQGQHSVRINDQYRICFRWTESGPVDVEVVDYH